MQEIRGFGIHPIPSEDLIKQIQLARIKTKAGKIAYLMLLGKDVAVSTIHSGIREAEGALKYMARIMEERIKE